MRMPQHTDTDHRPLTTNPKPCAQQKMPKTYPIRFPAQVKGSGDQGSGVSRDGHVTKNAVLAGSHDPASELVSPQTPPRSTLDSPPPFVSPRRSRGQGSGIRGVVGRVSNPSYRSFPRTTPRTSPGGRGDIPIPSNFPKPSVLSVALCSNSANRFPAKPRDTPLGGAWKTRSAKRPSPSSSLTILGGGSR